MAVSRKGKVTLSLVERLQPGDVVRDQDLIGFGVRRQQDAITYFVRAWVSGRQRWFTIGQHGKGWTPDSARKEARRILGNPAEARKTTIESKPFAEGVALFEKLHGPKLRPGTLAEYSRQIRLLLVPAFGRMMMDTITRGDVARAHAKWSETPRMANHALAVMSKVMSWAEEQGYRQENTNPCLKVERYRERRRERYLSIEEVGRIGEALRSVEAAGAVSVSAAAAIRLLIVTGARRSEVLTLKWSFVDLERRLILLPESKTGEKAIRLNAAAVDLLEQLPRVVGNPYVLPGHKLGHHLVDIQKPWEDVRALAKLPDLRLHDLRHTFASVAVASGGSLPVIGRMLGHSNPHTTQRYAHIADDPLASLSESTGQVLSAALSGKRKKRR